MSTADLAALRAVVQRAVEALDARHREDTYSIGGGCVMCWPNDRSYPCTSKQVADELRQALGDR